MAVSEDSLGRSDVNSSPASPLKDVNNSVKHQKNVFKAMRMCRLARDINCAEIIGNSLLLGVDDGLYSFEADGKVLSYIQVLLQGHP